MGDWTKPFFGPRTNKVLTAIFLIGVVYMIAGRNNGPTDSAPRAAESGTLSVSEEVFNKEIFGCSDWDTWTKLSKVVFQGDKEAFAKILYPALAAGTCRRFKVGEHAYLSETAILSGANCMRPKGATTCFWVPSDATGKP